MSVGVAATAGMSARACPLAMNHIPVLLSEVASLLCGQANSGRPRSLLDATIGLGGHTAHLMKEFPSLNCIVGIDRDTEALMQCKRNLKEKFPTAEIHLISNKSNTVLDRFSQASNSRRIILLHDVFSNLDLAMKRIGIKEVDCLLMDLGVSSLQLDKADRGFAFRFEGPLDMRMNQESGEMTALEFIAKSNVESLTEILERYGEERWSRRIAEKILERYAIGQLNSTLDLERICWEAYPSASRPKQKKNIADRQRKIIHPATRTFMALRLAVNNELAQLDVALKKIRSGLVAPGGRLGVISFHSLEDRIVKHTMRSWKAANLPCDIITKKPIQPTESEKTQNPRSRSAKLRVCQWL